MDRVLRGTHLWPTALAVLLLAGAAVPASAQDTGVNQVWLGQVGGNNLIDIVQEGQNNAAGADNIWLLLGQDGSDNSLRLDQYGYRNQLGTLFAEEPAYARGVWQRGNRNTIEIDQRATDSSGSNILGSVQQYSPIIGLPSANALSIEQTGTLAGHYIGRLVQFNASGTGTSNKIGVLQTEDDANDAGRGNILANVRQVGHSNDFDLIQRGQNNRLGDVPVQAGKFPIGGAVQMGADNSARIEQLGTGNTVEYLHQYGRDNATIVSMSGTGNAIFQILQNSESWLTATVGNRLEVSITGMGNGGQSWVGEFLLPGALSMPGIVQGVLQQLGEDNDMRLTIVQGVDSRFGVSQNGDANGAYVTISATAPPSDAENNTSAIFQNGDLNYVRHDIKGYDNLAAIAQIGEGNRLSVNQTGERNSVVVRIEKDKNNSAFTSLVGSALTVSSIIADLSPGDIRQIGGDNISTFDVIGNYNAFLAAQSGSENVIAGTINGAQNSLAIVQAGLRHHSTSVQIGTNNSLGVHQF